MKRQLLDVCLLAYPRARRERDRDYLRDLALDLSETYGLPRQALSLVRGGLSERAEGRRRRRSANSSAWTRQIVVACLVLAALTIVATGPTGPAAADSEVEVFTCVSSGPPRPARDQVRLNGFGGCGDTRRLVAARVRAGWDCTTRRGAPQGDRAIAWRCTRGRELLA